jgi:glyoxylase-like metal-dependent hydrolase (beta-lactamase superfamily II)
MKIKSFQGGYDKNFTYVIWCSRTKLAAIIDPSTEINPIIEYIENHDLILSKILITHTHHDHIAYLNDFLDLFNNIIVYCYYQPINLKNDFVGLNDNEMIMIGNQELTAIYTPGHLSDSMCFWNKEHNILFTGDTIFVGRTGRIKSPSSNIKQLYDSVYNKILTLPQQTMIYPGHHYGCYPCITIQKNIDLFDFFSCQTFEEFCIIMENFEKNR